MWAIALLQMTPLHWRRFQWKDTACQSPAAKSHECQCRRSCFALRQILSSQLYNIQGHLLSSYGLAEYYTATGGEFGSGVRAISVLNALNTFALRFDRIKRYLKSRKGLTHHKRRRAIKLRLAAELSAVLMQDLKQFAGQMMLLPISLEVYGGVKAKDCKVVLDYGGKLMKIQGGQFNGKCSRIPLEVYPDSSPKVTLIHRRKTMGIFLKEDHAGEVQVRHSISFLISFQKGIEFFLTKTGSLYWMKYLKLRIFAEERCNFIERSSRLNCFVSSTFIYL